METKEETGNQGAEGIGRKRKKLTEQKDKEAATNHQQMRRRFMVRF